MKPWRADDYHRIAVNANGQWSVVSGQLPVVSDQWAVVSCPSDDVTRDVTKRTTNN